MSNTPENIQENAAEDATENDDFNAGFESNDDLPTTTPEAFGAEEPNEPEAPALATITQAEYQDLLKKAGSIDEVKAESKRQFDVAFGRIGGLQRFMEQLQSSNQSGEAIQVSEDDFEELKAEFPELAAPHVKGLNRALAKLRGNGGSAIDPQVIDQMFGERFAKQAEAIRSEVVDASLEAVFPGWADEVRSTGFNDWLKTQPGWRPEMETDAWKDAINDENSPLSKWVKENPNSAIAYSFSNNVGDAARMLRMYEASKNGGAPGPAHNSTRQKILEANVNPRGTGGHAPGRSDDDDFEAGFNGR